jgi:hypothetical protein
MISSYNKKRLSFISKIIVLLKELGKGTLLRIDWMGEDNVMIHQFGTIIQNSS